MTVDKNFIESPIFEQIWNQINIEFVIKFAILYFFIMWIGMIIWVIKDIKKRTNNLFYQLFSILIIILFTPFGIVIYLALRPGTTMIDRFYLEIDKNINILSKNIEGRLKEVKI